MRPMLQDLHYAVRQLRNAPAFALTAVLTLALGIGINAAMFSVVDQVLLREMPFPKSGEVVQMAVRTEAGGFSATSMPDIRDWQARSHSFQGIAYYTEQVPAVGGAAEPKLTPQIVSSPTLLELLGVQPLMGRGLAAADGQAGHENVAVLSAGLWQEIFHGDPQVVGKTLRVNATPYAVIGVMPPGFAFPVGVGDDSIWTPLIENKATEQRDSASLNVIARLRPGITVAEAAREMNSIHEQLKREYPKEEDTNPVQVVPYATVVTGAARPAIMALDVAVLAVWLIACANVAGLLLARANNRRREMALRTALGASRVRIVRQLLTESLLLSLSGGAIGLGLAGLALKLLKRYLADAVIFGDQIHIDWRVCAYLLAASCLSAIMFGLFPALQVSRVPPQEGLRQGAVSSGNDRKHSRWRDGLVVGEIALTLTLLVAAGLMAHTLMALRHTRTGFVAEKIVTAEMYLPAKGMQFTLPAGAEHEPTLIQTFYLPLLERMQALPGTESVGLTTVRPLQGNWDFNMDVELADHPKPERAAQAYAQARGTSAAYFRTMGIRLLQGRFFDSDDSASAPPTAIVNSAFVQRFLPNENPIGQMVRMNDKGNRQWSRIVGVVDDSPQKTLGQPPLPEIHYNLAQLLPQDDLYPILGTFFMNISVRSPLSSATVEAELKRVVHELQPDVALQSVQTMQTVVDRSLGNQILAVRLLGLFAFAGLAMAIAGIYGLLAYLVGQRTRELGIRLALGAQREDVLWLVLRHAVILLGLGVVLGSVVTAASEKLLSSFLVYKLNGYDALVAGTVLVVLTVCGLAASYLPARRASGIDPMVALRTE